MSGQHDQNVAQSMLPAGVPPLTTFYLYLTDGCNLACQHCWITPMPVDGKHSIPNCLSLESLKKAVTETKPLGLKAVKLTGGEPTLHPDFFSITDFLSESELRISMETNGTLIDASMAHHLHDINKLSHIAVSIDSPIPEQHDRFRGKQGAYADAIRGLRHLVDAGFKPQIIMSIYRDNYDQIDDMVELAVKLGAGSMKFNPITASGRGAIIHEQGLALSFDKT